MSEIDEGLNEILGRYILRPTFNRRMAIQAILDLMCKLRGCEPETRPEGRGLRMVGPCKWCGAVQRGEG